MHNPDKLVLSKQQVTMTPYRIRKGKINLLRSYIAIIIRRKKKP